MSPQVTGGTVYLDYYSERRGTVPKNSKKG